MFGGAGKVYPLLEPFLVEGDKVCMHLLELRGCLRPSARERDERGCRIGISWMHLQADFTKP